MSKIGFNIYSFSKWKQSPDYPAVINTGSGIWLPDKHEPNPVILGRYKEIGCTWLRYGSGGECNEMTYAEAMSHGFTLTDFVRCCEILDANPIITVSTLLPAAEAGYIVRHVRKLTQTAIYLEVGNESWWPPETAQTVEVYVAKFKEIKNSLSDIENIRYGIPLVDGTIYKELDGWNEGIASCEAHWGSAHLYLGDTGQVSESIRRIYNETGLPLIVTEWNYPENKLQGYDKYRWTLDILRLFEGCDEVIGHCMWDSGAGTTWKLFEKDFKPTADWQAFEAFTNE